jgi:MinD superfamily P-loop ATPase
VKQLLILSGKGGTGKTTLASAFIRLSDAGAYADCDVDAPNLHLIMGQDAEPDVKAYYGLPKAEIDPALCTRCDRCRQHCRFDAISADDGYRVNSFACEGCGVCRLVCPAGAVSLKPAVSGALMLYADSKRVFSTARLQMGSGNSGLLVTGVKKQMAAAAAPDTELAIIDGSPGIGCPVIASLSGVDMVLIVAEPSVSGISDLERIVKTAAQFKVKTAVCVNKYDTNHENAAQIERFCSDRGLAFVGRVPFDTEAAKAVNSGRTIVDTDCPSGQAARTIYRTIIELLFDEGGRT